jgi:hypothetical protein
MKRVTTSELFREKFYAYGNLKADGTRSLTEEDLNEIIELCYEKEKENLTHAFNIGFIEALDFTKCIDSDQFFHGTNDPEDFLIEYYF